MRRSSVAGAALATALLAISLASCAGAERRSRADAGTFRLSSAAHGDVLALVARENEAPRVRLVGGESDGEADGGSGGEANGESGGAGGALDRWRLVPFGRGLYRLASDGADGRLSLAVDYRVSAERITAAVSGKSASQLWHVIPLGDGHCRLGSALFPDRSLGVAAAAARGADAALPGVPRLVAGAEVIEQRWRLVPIEGAATDAPPSPCDGTPGPADDPRRDALPG